MPAPPRGHDPTLAWNTKLLTIEEYAALCAEVAVWPDRTTQAHARQGIATIEDGDNVHKMFAIRFIVDPELEARWRVLVEQYAAWMRKHGP